MKILDGAMLKSMLISGSNNLYNHYPEVDALNVFPVPDGDTGMNMNLTMTSGMKEIQNRNDKNIGDVAKAFSKGLLMGARGNSGVITSQIFRGIALGMEGKESVDAIGFADAFQKGTEVAYKAVMRPVEGTILTVIRESSQALRDHVQEDDTILDCMKFLIKEAKASLKRTPELLPVLKEVGVVDSGGFGLVVIFDGMLSALQNKFIERNKATATESVNPIQAAAEISEDEEFGYCTEFIMELGPDSVKKPFNEKRFIANLLNKGNSLAVVRDEEIVKVHIHTMQPGNVLNYAQTFGEFKTLKIENMTEQHHALEVGASNAETPVQNAKKEKYAIIAVSAGEGISNFFKEIGVSQIVFGGQTMNPSTEDFISAIKAANAENVIILPNNSNIVLAASQACDVMSAVNGDVNCVVVPTKTIPQGITAAIMFNPEATIDENQYEMKHALKNVKSGSVTFAIRDTTIDGVKVKKDDFIGIVDKEIICYKRDKIDATIALLEKMVDENSAIITVLVGQDVTEKERIKLSSYICKSFPDVDLDIRDGDQPVYSFLVGVE